MAKTIEIPAGQICEDSCENLATEVIDHNGYAPTEFVCYSCHEARAEAWYHVY